MPAINKFIKNSIKFLLSFGIFLIPFYFVIIALPVSANTHVPGTNIMYKGQVYFLDGLTISPYLSDQAFRSYGFNLEKANLLGATSEDLSLPIGEMITLRDGTLINDHGTIYTINNGQRAAFVSAEVFLKLGYSWSNILRGDISSMPDSEPINSFLRIHPVGTLINDHGTIFLISPIGKIGIPNLAIFNSWGFNLKRVVQANAFDRAYPESVITLQTRPVTQISALKYFSSIYNSNQNSNQQSSPQNPITVPVNNQQPVVNIQSAVLITTPNNGQNISGTIIIQSRISGSTNLINLQYQIDNFPVGPVIHPAPYQFILDTHSLKDGIHTISALVSDQANNSFSTSITVTVANNLYIPVGGVSSLPAPPSSTPPTVSITAPTAGATVSGSTTVTATATAFAGATISNVQFKLDGTNLGTAQTSSPYQISWDTTASPNGSHTLTAVAADSASNSTTSSSVSLTVANPPVISSVSSSSITSTGATITWTTNINSNSKVNYGTTSSYGSNTTLDTAQVTSHSENITGLTQHTLYHYQVVSADSLGNLASSLDFTFTTSSTPPTVSITAPTAGATVSGSTTVTATATAFAGATISNVQFKLDGTNLGTAQTSSPYQISWDTTASSNGSHTLTAVATDSASNATTSSAVSVTVNNVSVSITVPTAGATVSGITTLTATASSSGATITQIQFKIDGANLGLPVTSSPFSITWNTLTASNATHTIQAVATDSNGLTGSASINITVLNSSGSPGQSIANGWNVISAPAGTVPHFRGWTKMIYDSAQSKSIYYASVSDNHIYSDTVFGYNSTGQSWAQLDTNPNANTQCPANTVTFPSNRHTYQAFAYDSTRKRLWMFSGVCQNVSSTDTWYYDSQTSIWNQVSPATNPGGRTETAMAYDPINDVIVLYGGTNGVGTTLSDTWQYSPSANTWTQITTTGSPGPLTGQQMLYDPTLGRIFMYGGATSLGALEGTTIWLYNVATHTWTSQSPSTSPPATLGYPIMTYDSTRNRETLYTGSDNLWAYDSTGVKWTHVGVLSGPNTFVSGGAGSSPGNMSMDYDPVTDQFIAFSYAGCGGCWQTNVLKLATTGISITSPSASSNLSGTVTINTSVISDVGITNVQFKLDGVNLGSAVTSSPYQFSWDTTAATNASHTLTAVITDSNNSTVTSAAISVTVNNSLAPIAFVQDKTAASTTGNSGTTITATFNSNVTAGNLLVVAVSDFSATPNGSSITDSLGNTFTMAGSVLTTVNNSHSALYYAKNILGGADTVTFTLGTTNNAMSISAAEFSGANTISPLDKTAGAIQGGGSTASSGSMTPTNNNELAIGAGTHDTDLTVTAGTGFTLVSTDDTAGHQPLAFEYQILTSTSAVNPSFSFSTGAAWTQNGALFKQ